MATSQLRWRKLLPGFGALLAVIGIAAGILLFGRVDALRGDTVELYAAMGDARGIARGSEVWLSGQKIGLVRGIGFARATSDLDTRVVVKMEILARPAEHVRLDSPVQLHPGGTLIGATVVDVGEGTPQSRPVVAGDTLRGNSANDFEDAASRVAIAGNDLPAILANVKTLSGQLRSRQGTIGAFGAEGGGPQLADTRQRLANVGEKVSTGRGTLALAFHSSPSLGERARLLMARADSLTRLASSPRTGMGRFRSDSTLTREVARVRDELTVVQEALRSGDGILGRMNSDSALTRAVSETRLQMQRLFADLSRHPTRYIQF